MRLEEILEGKKLNGSRHDRLVKAVDIYMTRNFGYETIARNAYYNFPSQHTDDGQRMESDIDLLQVAYNRELYPYNDWEDIPPPERVTHLYEMKTWHNPVNYAKAKKQLKRSKYMLQEKTDLVEIDTYYCFWQKNKKGIFVMRREEV